MICHFDICILHYFDIRVSIFSMSPEQILAQIGSGVWQIFKAWWWLPLPFLLIRPFLFLWLWWRQQLWTKNVPKVILEIKFPSEILKPIKAMETVFAGFWAAYDPPNWKEKWIEGKYLLALSLEIVNIDGKTHFLIRTPKALQRVIESNIYAQYPDAEIAEVPDYTQAVPEDIPNDEWDLWGCSFQTLKEDIYPIKTYAKFFEERGEAIAKEEKRIDPIASLLEGLANLKKGEQMWIQFLIKPITNAENNFVDRGKAKVEELVRRPKKEKLKPIIQEAIELLIFPPKKEEGKMAEKEIIPPEMKLTPGEREIVSAIEEKIGKYSFEVCIRFIYLGKKDVFFKPYIRIPLAYFNQFSTQNLNGLKPWGKTITKVTYFFVKRRLYLKKRRIFRLYKARLRPFFPRPYKPGGLEGVMVLNIEELASLFHFPSKAVAQAPFLERLEAKKGEAPPGLPTE